MFDVVWGLGVPLGRERGVEFRQRESLVQVSGDQAQTLRSPGGRQLSRGRLSTESPREFDEMDKSHRTVTQRACSRGSPESIFAVASIGADGIEVVRDSLQSLKR